MIQSLARYAIGNGGSDTEVVFPKTLLGGRYAAGNPTCAVFGGSLVFNTRLVNYRKIVQSERFKLIGVPKNQTYFLHKNGFESRNAVFTMDGGLLSGFRETDYGAGDAHAYYRGFEDCRLVVWDGCLYAYGTRWDKVPGEGRICIYRLNSDMQPVSETVVESPFGANCEKNWAAVDGMPFCFIYMYNPMTVVKVTDMDSGKCEIVERHDESGIIPSWLGIKGSTPVARLDSNTLVSLVHRTDSETDVHGMEHIFYRTAFVLMDKGFNITKMSNWFVFRTDLCEFTCGLSILNGTVYIPYSQVDCTVNILEMPLSAVIAFIEGDIGEFPAYGPEYILNLARKYETAEQFATSDVMYNYHAALVGVADKQGAQSAAKAFSGLVPEFPDLVEPNLVGSVERCILKAIADSGGNGFLYKPLSETARFQGRVADAERYTEIGRKKTLSLE